MVQEEPSFYQGDSTRPYLTVIGSPALRFQAEALPPDPIEKIAITPSVQSTADPANETTRTDVFVSSTTATEVDEVIATSPKTGSQEGPVGPTSAAILPDDIHPMVRPEDFLPYFQIPGSRKQPGEAMFIVPTLQAAPASATLPASSATYIQKTK